jgi:hypothetical protein
LSQVVLITLSFEQNGCSIPVGGRTAIAISKPDRLHAKQSVIWREFNMATWFVMNASLSVTW